MIRALFRFARACALLLCVTAAACDSPTLPARASSDVYDFRLRSDTFHVFRWPSGKQVRVYVQPGAVAPRDTMLIASFERGAAEWNARALFGEYELVRAVSLAEADVVMRWSEDPPPVSVEECPPVFSNGVTTFCIEDPDAAMLRLAAFPLLPPGDPAATNIKLLVTILGSQSTITGRIDRLVAHELGHVLGIGQHSPDTADLMSAGIPLRATLSARDAATVQVLYHTTPDIMP